MNTTAYKVTLRTVFSTWVQSPLPGTKEEVEAHIKAQYAALGFDVVEVRLQYSEGEPTQPTVPDTEITAIPYWLEKEFPYRRAKFRHPAGPVLLEQ